MKKVFLTTITLLANINVFAYSSDLDCPKMEVAHRKATTARLQSINSNATNAALDKILENIEDGMIFRHCKLKELGNEATHVTVTIKPSLFNCLEKTITKRLVAESRDALQEAVHEYGGFRAKAEKQASDLTEQLREDIKANCNE